MVPADNEREIRLRYVGKGIQYLELREHVFNWVQQNQMGQAPMQVDAFGREREEESDSSESDEDEDVAVLGKKGGKQRAKAETRAAGE